MKKESNNQKFNQYKQKFKRDGFVVVPQLFSNKELNLLNSIYNDILINFQKDSTNYDKGINTNSFVWIYNVESYVNNITKLNSIIKLADLASTCLGITSSNLIQEFRIFHKPATIGAATPWHQDEAYQSPFFIHNSLNAWIPIGSFTEFQGCMKYVIGSHLKGIYDHEVIENVSEGLGLSVRDVDNNNCISIPVKKGDVILHHCRTLHSAHPNLSNKPRKALVVINKSKPIKKNIITDIREWQKCLQKYWNNHK